MNWWIVSCVLATVLSAGLAKKKVVCYYESWSAYGKGKAGVQPEDIDPHLCTHVIYSFIGLKKDGSIHLNDKYLDLSDDGGLDCMGRLGDLRKKNADLKVMVAIGGWDEGSKKFSEVVHDKDLRKTFVKNLVKFLGKHQFDGLDVDWEYPTARGGRGSDKKHFGSLLKELRKKFDEHGYVLSAAISADQGQIDESYDIPDISEHLDFINVMSYDYASEGDSKVGHNAPLYPSKGDQSVKDTIAHLLHRGAPNEKLIMGMPAYGRSFKLKDKSKTKPGSPASGVGIDDGYVNYNKFCGEVKNGWDVIWDDDMHVPYAVEGSNWVGYDNPRSFAEKAQYVVDNKLGGGMVWAIDGDDVHNVCGEGKFPLISAMKKTFGG